MNHLKQCAWKKKEMGLNYLKWKWRQREFEKFDGRRDKNKFKYIAALFSSKKFISVFFFFSRLYLMKIQKGNKVN